ncbi:MAG: Asp-tRNA(Asn)/Glu-tRNA(Gln) amidotransferase subunit GatB [Gammaproteobacteria bacterium]|nr:Asp-tRNA(Asn)/Glu-tRNA(Gln) amidotransferase subunit GatB [Gammaproteobacteria bacterium]
MQWEPVIGLEVHVQLMTNSKLFSGASITYGAQANRQACPISIALPGVLPVMNIEAARLAVRFGLAIGAKVEKRSVFERKNYFYPDLPKGYQISQYKHPIVSGGRLTIATGSGEKAVGITRAHLEEDAGKSVHENFHGMTGIDLNRAGTPLLEIVSNPDMRSAEEAVAYLKKLHALVRYFEVSDGNMQEGSFRCDANVSIRPKGNEDFGTRTELKNINSFRFVEKAINFEIERQIDVLEDGGAIIQETRLYDSERNETRSMRSKEDAQDYRYFPDPDLPEMILDDEFIERVRDSLPESPDQRKSRYEREFSLPSPDAEKLLRDRDTADFFERVCKRSKSDPKTVANWINGELAALLNERHIEIADSPVDSDRFAALMDRMADNTLSRKMAKDVLAHLATSPKTGQSSAEVNLKTSVDDIIESRGFKQITDSSEIERLVEEVLDASAPQVQQYREGNQKVFGYLMGQVMKTADGKADPGQVNRILRNRLE